MPDAHPTSTAPLTARRTRRATLRPVRLPPRSRPASSRRGARHIRACVPCPPAPASPPRAWFAQCGQHKASPGRRPLRVEQARWRQGLGQRGALVLVRAVQRARERRDIRRVAAAGGLAQPRGVRSGSRSCSGSRRIEGIKKHAHRQRVLARPARALILGVPGAGATVLRGLGAQRDPVALLRRLHRVLPSPSRRTPPPATSLRASANRGCNVSSSPACTGSGRWKYAPAARSNPTWPEDASTPSADAICASGNRARRPAARYRCAARKPAASTRTPRPHSHRRPRPDAAPRPRPRTPAPFPGSDPA